MLTSSLSQVESRSEHQDLHIAERLKIDSRFCGERRDMSLELLFVVLVVTIIDPSRSLREYTQDACSGTLVREHLVVTAASCLVHSSHEHPSPKHTFVCVRGGGNHKAVKIYLHPEFSRAEQTFNVAVIKIEKSNVSEFPKLSEESIKIQDDIRSGKCKAGGYGNLVRLTVVDFQATAIDTVSQMECKGRPPSMVCLNFEKLRPCNGDVGSPIVCGNELYAIFTPATAIDPITCLDLEKSGFMFTRVQSIREWIEGIINSPDYDLEWMASPVFILLLSGGILLIIVVIYCLIKKWMEKKVETLRCDLSLSSKSLEVSNSGSRRNVNI